MIPYLTFLSLNHLGGHWPPGWLLYHLRSCSPVRRATHVLGAAALSQGGGTGSCFHASFILHVF